MKKLEFTRQYTDPVVIGGMGGSGTRLIAECVKEMGFFIGNDLNPANDNLWFTLLFKRIEILFSSDEEFDELIDIFIKGMTGRTEFTLKQVDLINDLASIDRKQHPATWLRQRANSLLENKHTIGLNDKWGWKEPNTHIVLDRLKNYFGRMKYIHVVRNGLDMAHSNNQNQLNLWGRHFIGEDFTISPYYSLQYWCIIHKRILDIGKLMGNDFLFLNYDDFCVNQEQGITQLSEFLGFNASKISNLLLDLIRVPSTIGRFKKHGTKLFDPKDVEYVKQLGFDITTS